MTLALLLSSLIAVTFAADPLIWPLPSKFNVSPMPDLCLSNSFNISSHSNSEILQGCIQRYMNDIIFTHIPDQQPSNISSIVTSLTITVKSADEDLQLGIDESYELNIKPGDSSTLSANTIYGAMRGLETFSQLVTFNFSLGYYQTSTSTITDQPRFKWRGTMIDTSRHFQSIPEIKRLLDAMSYTKLNTLHWHITDEQSFPFASRKYPLFIKGAYDSRYQAYSLTDVAEIVSYAKERGIRVVPEFDVPGHSYSWCAGYPQICPNPACTMNNGILNPATNATYQILEGLFTEATNIFFDDYFHIGGDETHLSCWGNDPDIVSWEKANGHNDTDALLYFFSRTLDIVNKLNRKPVQWDDVAEKFLYNLTNNETMFDVWHGAMLQNVTDLGFNAMFSGFDTWYLAHLNKTWKAMYNWEPTDHMNNSNMHLFLGGEGCMWGENVDVSDIEQTIWPRMAAIAERLWSPKDVNNVTLAEPRYANFRCLLNERGTQAAPYNNTQARSPPPAPGSCYLQR